MIVSIQGVAKCCQMSNVSGKPTDPNAWLKGWGSGGDRCMENCTEMSLATYNPPTDEQAVENDMYKIVEAWNNNSDVSAPEPGWKLVDWIQSHDSRLTVVDVRWPSFQAFVNVINKGHMIVAGFNDYNKLMKSDGTSPYSWQDPNGLGHVLVVLGYDDVNQYLLVHDPLIGVDFQPQFYTFKSFQNAQCADLLEIVGPALPLIQGVEMPVPNNWKDDGTLLHNPQNSFVAKLGFRKHILDSLVWDEDDVPLEDEGPVGVLAEYDPSLGAGNEQVFAKHVLMWNSTINVREMECGREIMALRKQAAPPTPLNPKIRQALTDASAIFTSAGAIAAEIADAIKQLPQ